jgi:predicted TIM-barrel fold metal-dependent hydrolase
LVWGSDWPHPTENWPKDKPNDAQLLDLLLTWVGDQGLIEKILVTNPNNLYQFS